MDLKGYKYPEQMRAKRSAASSIKLPEPNLQRHHWNYNRRYEVVFLTDDEHRRIHKLIEYDPVTRVYKAVDTGEVLDTKDKHVSFIKSSLGKTNVMVNVGHQKYKII